MGEILFVIDAPLEARPSKLSRDQTRRAGIGQRLHKLDQRVSLGSQPFVLKNQSCYRIDNYSLGPDLADTRLNHLNQSCHRELLSADGQFSNLYLGWKIPDRRSLQKYQLLVVLKVREVPTEIKHFLEYVLLIFVQADVDATLLVVQDPIDEILRGQYGLARPRPPAAQNCPALRQSSSEQLVQARDSGRSSRTSVRIARSVSHKSSKRVETTCKPYAF